MVGVVVIGWNSMNASKLAVAISASMQFGNLGMFRLKLNEMKF